MYENKSKLKTLDAISSYIADGDLVAVGGTLSARQPMAIIREIIRQGKKDLTTIGGAHGIDIDLLVAGNTVKAVHNSFVGFEYDFGIAPNYRRAAQEGRIEIRDTDCDFILNQLRAAQYGVPFMPMPLVQGTELLKIHPEYKTMKCPYTGKNITVVPALKPDVAIIHAHYGDCEGNIKLFKPHFADLLFATAARKTIVSVEEVLPTEKLKELEPELPGHQVDLLVEVPFGAHPTSCYPNYAYDREHISEYIKSAQIGSEVFQKEYLEKFVFGIKSQKEYLDLVGGDCKLKKLQDYSGSHENWKEVFVSHDN